MSLIGSVIKGNFEILDKVGQGGMASVYRARQISLDRIVAVKVLSGSLRSLDEARKRFEQEAKIVARLNHPNIVQVHDIDEIEEDDGNLCIIMEHIDGRTLAEVLAEQRPLRVDRAMAVASEIASGLAYAHGQGVVHRDIKPQNIMLVGDDHVKIMDFGIARFRDSTLHTRTGATMGTPEYMSPEQAEGQAVDFRTDLYSLAVVLYVMVTGELPFTGESAIAIGLKHIREKPRSPRGLNPAVRPELEAIILKGLAKKPEDRFSNAEEFRQALINTTPTTPIGGLLADESTVVVSAATPPAGKAPQWKIAKGGLVSLLSGLRSLRGNPRAMAVGGVTLAILLVILISALTPGGRKAITISQADLNDLPPHKLLQKLDSMRASDAEGMRSTVVRSEQLLYDRIGRAIRQADSEGDSDRSAMLRSLVSSAIRPQLSDEKQARWESLVAMDVPVAPTPTPAPTRTPVVVATATPTPRITPAPTAPPTPTPVVTVQPNKPPLPPREIELSLRRLNKSTGLDPGKARQSLEKARAAVRRLRDLPVSDAAYGETLSQCLAGFVDAVAYDRGNWRHSAEFAAFLSNNADKWNLSDDVRDGLLQDARQLLVGAQERCTDPGERESMAVQERSIQRMLNLDE